MGGRAQSELRDNGTALFDKLSGTFKTEQKTGFIRIILAYLIGAALLFLAHTFVPQAEHLVIFVVIFAIMFYQPYVMYRYGFLRKGSKMYIYHRFIFGLIILIGGFSLAVTIFVIVSTIAIG